MPENTELKIGSLFSGIISEASTWASNGRGSVVRSGK